MHVSNPGAFTGWSAIYYVLLHDANMLLLADLSPLNRVAAYYLLATSFYAVIW